MLLLAVLCLIAFVMPWSFKYLIMTPILGLCLGGFVWGAVGLLWAPNVVSFHGFFTFVTGGMLLVALMVRRFDS